MSTIATVEKNGQIAVAADTLITGGGPRTSPYRAPQPKVIRVRDTLIGATGLSVYYPLLRAYFARNESISLTDESQILDAFVAFWRFLREEYHFVNDQSDTDDLTPFADTQAEFIVANRAGLFCVREILSVARYEKFLAVGSGASHAEGAARALFDQPLTAAEIARSAVEIACEFDRASGGETQVYEFDKE